MLGNIRIQRLAFAYLERSEVGGKDDLYIRVTGLANRKRLVDAMRQRFGSRPQIEETKDAKSTPIAVFQDEGDSHAPIVALIGDTDLLMATSSGPRPVAKNAKSSLEPVFAVRDLKSPSVLKGDLKDRVTTVSKSFGILAGSLPRHLSVDMFRRDPSPRCSIRFELFHTNEGIDLRVQATMANAEDAMSFVKAIKTGGQLALAQLHEASADLKELSASVLAGLKSDLEGVQLQTRGASVQCSVHARNSTLLAVPYLLMVAGGDFAGARPAPAIKK